MIELSELTEISLREIWEHETHDFTPWLETNIQRLGDVLELELDVIETEASVGNLSLDLLAKEKRSGQTVIIENQLEPADHKHLGQLLSYAAGLDADIIIWISEDVKEEYRQVLDWLNQKTTTEIQFFAVLVKIVKIEDSKPALDFRPIVLPNEWQKQQKQETKTLSPRHEKRKNYFQELIDKLRDEHKFTRATKGQHYTYHNFTSRIVSEIQYGAMLRVADSKAVVYVHIAEGIKGGRQTVYDALHSQKNEIEKEIGQPLQWEWENEDGNFSRIAVSTDGSIDANENELKKVMAWHIENLLNFKAVFHPKIELILKTLSS